MQLVIISMYLINTFRQCKFVSVRVCTEQTQKQRRHFHFICSSMSGELPMALNMSNMGLSYCPMKALACCRH